MIPINLVFAMFLRPPASCTEVLGKKAAIDRQPLQPRDVPRTWADIEKASRLLGFRPRTPLTEGLANFVAWLFTQERPSG